MISICVVAYNRDAMLAKTRPALEASIARAACPCELVTVTDGPMPFSAGAWRTIAAKQATGDTIIMLDADMLVPLTFVASMASLAAIGVAAFPLYVRERGPGGPTSPGNGWGNAAFSRQVWERMLVLTRGQPYGTATRWGGEDVSFARILQANRLAPVWRRVMPGLVHLWHPKTGSLWYGGEGVGMQGDGEP